MPPLLLLKQKHFTEENPSRTNRRRWVPLVILLTIYLFIFLIDEREHFIKKGGSQNASQTYTEGIQREPTGLYRKNQGQTKDLPAQS